MNGLSEIQLYARRAEAVHLIVMNTFEIRKDPGMKERKGAYFNVSNQGVSIACGLLGQVPQLEKRAKYFRLSNKKCSTLFEHRSLGHRLSRESMDEEKEQYAGAVVGNRNEYSFSGYLALVDEVAAALFAFYCGDLRYEHACSWLHDNEYFPLFEVHFTRSFENSSRL